MNYNSTIDLAGTWDFSLAGEKPVTFEHTLQLPGSLQAQGFGADVTLETPWTGGISNRSWFDSDRYACYRQPGNLKIPFWLQPKKYFRGPAWYRRSVDIPEAWSGRRIVLFLERPHIETRVWFDDREIGANNSLSTPHEYDLGTDIAPGWHRLTIRVDNRLVVDVGVNSHSVSDHTQTNWNGIIGRMELIAGSPVWIDDVQAFPEVATRSVRLQIRVGNWTERAGCGTLELEDQSFDVSWEAGGGEIEILHPLGEQAPLWDEFEPSLHRLRLTLVTGERVDEREVVFGLREAGTEGTQFTLNGRKIFLRGTLECCVFPKTGYPPTDVAEWKRILSTISEYGFNHVRFHSWCPPEAAFKAADELGLYLQVECASWANMSTTLGEGEAVDEWLYEEGRRIVRTYGNHPSFMLMAYGNEPGKDPARFTAYLEKWVAHWKQEDRRRLHTTAAGWPAVPGNDFHNIPEPRLQQMDEGLNSRINRLPPATTADYRGFVGGTATSEVLQELQARDSWNLVALETLRPVVSHEIGQWCVYPDFSEIPKYTGLLEAKNFEIFRESLEANHMGDQAGAFVHASGKLQILCYREEFESSLRTKGFGGYQALQMNDFPGQGTALVGWMNAFWESKGYTTPEEFRRFNHSTVLLARLERRIFNPAMMLRAELEAARFEPAPLENARPYWRLVDDTGAVCFSGDLPAQTLPVDNGISLGSLSLSLHGLPAPAKYRFVVGLADTSFENDWEIWLYPEKENTRANSSVLLVRDWEELLQHVQAETEKKILFIPPAETVNTQVQLGFSPIFWNTSWTNGQAPHTLGILCDPDHPVFDGFPTECHTNWQWWELLQNVAVILFDGLAPGFRPLVQVIDDWFTNRRLGLLFEARLGRCRVVISGMDLVNDLSNRHVARQMRSSILAYMESESFQPAHRLDALVLARMLGNSIIPGEAAADDIRHP